MDSGLLLRGKCQKRPTQKGEKQLQFDFLRSWVGPCPPPSFQCSSPFCPFGSGLALRPGLPLPLLGLGVPLLPFTTQRRDGRQHRQKEKEKHGNPAQQEGGNQTRPTQQKRRRTQPQPKDERKAAPRNRNAFKTRRKPSSTPKEENQAFLHSSVGPGLPHPFLQGRGLVFPFASCGPGLPFLPLARSGPSPSCPFASGLALPTLSEAGPPLRLGLFLAFPFFLPWPSLPKAEPGLPLFPFFGWAWLFTILCFQIVIFSK